MALGERVSGSRRFGRLVQIAVGSWRAREASQYTGPYLVDNAAVRPWLRPDALDEIFIRIALVECPAGRSFERLQPCPGGHVTATSAPTLRDIHVS